LPGLFLGRSIVDFILGEQRCAGDDLIAALDRDSGQQSCLGRTDLDEIGFGIALPYDGRRAARGPPPDSATRDNKEK